MNSFYTQPSHIKSNEKSIKEPTEIPTKRRKNMNIRNVNISMYYSYRFRGLRKGRTPTRLPPPPPPNFEQQNLFAISIKP